MREVKRPQLPPLNWFDRAVLAIAPAWGAKRIASRRAFQAIESGFARIEAAEHDETRGRKWLASRLSPDSQLEQDLQTTRDRSREIYQNDAMGGVVDNKVNHVIGTGHTPQARVLLDSGEADEATNEQIEEVYGRWEPKADRSGRRSLWMLSRISARHNEFDGESFTVLSDVGRADKPIPLALQVLDPERVATPSKYAGDKLVRLGIRYTGDGEVVGYYVQRTHPGDTTNYSSEFDFIPADRMLHVFEPWFAEQSRGLPWMTRALNRAKDAKDFDEATILKCQVEACFAAFVKPGIGTGFLSASGAANGSTASNGKRLEDIIPGTIRHLDPGEDIAFATPTAPGGTFSMFQEWNYRRVAAAINWPYEMVVKNWNGLSFAAGRLVLTDAKKATEVGQKIMRELWFARVWERMVLEAVIVGAVDVAPGEYMADPWKYHRHVWIAPKWEYALNPGEEVDADLAEIEGNLATLEDKLGKRGADLEQFIARKQREKKLLDAAGLSPAPPVAPGPGRPPLAKPEAEAAPADTEQPEEVAA